MTEVARENVRCFNLKKPCLGNAAHKLLRPVCSSTNFVTVAELLAYVIMEQLIWVWKHSPLFDGITVIL